LLQLENEAWLTEMAEVVRREVVVPLLETVDGCGSLRGHVERVEAVERGKGGRASSGEGMFGELTWLELSRVATGRVVSLWEMIGKEAVVSRGKAILRHALSVDVDGIVERVGSGSGSGARAGTDDVGVCEAYEAFDRALGSALAEAVECVRMDGSVFEDVVAAEFGGLMERVTRRLEARLEELEGGDLGSETHSEDGHWTTTMLGIVRFTSLLQTRSEAYQRLLYVQHLGDAATEIRDRVLLPWARETSMRVGAVRAAATRAWATACAASILGAENVEQVEKATSSSSIITPMYPSEWLTRALTRFCGALEETVSSQEDLTRQSMETFKGALVRKLRDVYSDASVTDKSRTTTLQRIYDATFVKVLFWEERGDANDLATNELLRDLVTSMDPVEWEEHRAAIDANVRRYTHHVASYLRTSTEIPAVGKTVDTADAGNMELAARSVRFSYLPAKLPSRAPRPTTASASSAGDLGLGIGDVTLPTSAAQEPEFFSGLQGLARVKAAEVSDLLGSFL